MELIKFLNELKSNKYLSLNQLEYDINKLKRIVDNPKLKFDYVKPKKLINYVNELKASVNTKTAAIREAAEYSFKAASNVMPTASRLISTFNSDDDPYLLLGFLLSLDNVDDVSFENEDELLILIGMLMIDNYNPPTQSHKLDRQFRQKLIKLPYKLIFDTIPNTPTYILEAILNQIFSFLILSTYLLGEVKVCFSLTDVIFSTDPKSSNFLRDLNITERNKFVSIGTGLAITGQGQWNNTGQTRLFNSPNIILNTEAAASYTSIQILKNLLDETYKEKVADFGITDPSNPEGWVGSNQNDRNGSINRYGPTCAHVWGANIKNYNLHDNTEIPGSNQATAFKSVDHTKSLQSPGVFGIISTNLLMNEADIQDDFVRYKKALDKRSWPNIDDTNYILFYNVLKTIIWCNYKTSDADKRERDLLIDRINKIMLENITYPQYNTLVKKMKEAHLLLYRSKPKPAKCNEIYIHDVINSDPNPDPNTVSFFRIDVVIHNDSNEFYYQNKCLKLNRSRLNNVCTKIRDGVIIFYNFEDLEEYIDSDDNKLNKTGEEVKETLEKITGGLKYKPEIKESTETKDQTIARLAEIIRSNNEMAKKRVEEMNKRMKELNETTHIAEIYRNLANSTHQADVEKLKKLYSDIESTQNRATIDKGRLERELEIANAAAAEANDKRNQEIDKFTLQQTQETAYRRNLITIINDKTAVIYKMKQEGSQEIAQVKDAAERQIAEAKAAVDAQIADAKAKITQALGITQIAANKAHAESEKARRIQIDLDAKNEELARAKAQLQLRSQLDAASQDADNKKDKEHAAQIAFYEAQITALTTHKDGIEGQLQAASADLVKYQRELAGANKQVQECKEELADALASIDANKLAISESKSIMDAAQALVVAANEAKALAEVRATEAETNLAAARISEEDAKQRSILATEAVAIATAEKDRAATNRDAAIGAKTAAEQAKSEADAAKLAAEQALRVSKEELVAANKSNKEALDKIEAALTKTSEELKQATEKNKKQSDEQGRAINELNAIMVELTGKISQLTDANRLITSENESISSQLQTQNDIIIQQKAANKTLLDDYKLTEEKLIRTLAELSKTSVSMGVLKHDAAREIALGELRNESIQLKIQLQSRDRMIEDLEKQLEMVGISYLVTVAESSLNEAVAGAATSLLQQAVNLLPDNIVERARDKSIQRNSQLKEKWDALKPRPPPSTPKPTSVLALRPGYGV